MPNMDQWKLIDVHTHVNFNAYADDGEETIARAHDKGIGMILVGSQIDTSRRAIAYARKYKSGVWAAVGLHPNHLTQMQIDDHEVKGAPGYASRIEEFDEQAYLELAEDEKVVAIGEFGLDYFRTDASPATKQKQKEVVRQHIALARKVGKPLIIHCREAYDDMIRILKEERADEIGGDIHFFAGDWTIAKQFLDLNFHLSFTGVLTFTSQYDEVVEKMPLDRLMIETDAPYVAPTPFRGKRNEPGFVDEVARRVAEIRGSTFDEVARATTENAAKLFNLV